MYIGCEKKDEGQVFIGFGKMNCDFNLSEKGDLLEAASNLFRILHQVDLQGYRGIVVALVPDEGIGKAINDRLRRASYMSD